jgi:hypothetical protein
MTAGLFLLIMQAHTRFGSKLSPAWFTSEWFGGLE